MKKACYNYFDQMAIWKQNIDNMRNSKHTYVRSICVYVTKFQRELSPLASGLCEACRTFSGIQNKISERAKRR